MMDGLRAAASSQPGAVTRVSELAGSSSFTVLLGSGYEGPLDLLLALIRKQDIDVYDIPIARITEQFLAYTRALPRTDLDVAADFMYMATLLIDIKCKTLLPASPSASNGVDPRRELAERLLEHERFQAAALMLQERQASEEASWSRTGPALSAPASVTASAPPATAGEGITIDLVSVFRDLLDRIQDRAVLEVEAPGVSTERIAEYLVDWMSVEDRPVHLEALLVNATSPTTIVSVFLAVLELVRLQAVLVYQPVSLGSILLKKGESFDVVRCSMFQRAAGSW